MRRSVLLTAVSLFCLPVSSLRADPLRINGSTTVNLPVAEAAEVLRAEKKMEILVDTQGGSSGGISALGDGRVDIGMSSKPVSPEDRARYPDVEFHPVHIGEDAVALAVSRDVWEGGVRALTRKEVQGLYEGRIANWRELGGPDQRVVFFTKEPGRGTYEVFADWAYGEADRAPLVSLPQVGGNEEGRNKVAATPGSITQLSASWADQERVFALAIETAEGETISPTSKNIATHRYPMSRPLFLLTDGPPGGAAKVFVGFMLGTRGQALIEKHGYLSLDQLK